MPNNHLCWLMDCDFKYLPSYYLMNIRVSKHTILKFFSFCSILLKWHVLLDKSYQSYSPENVKNSVHGLLIVSFKVLHWVYISILWWSFCTSFTISIIWIAQVIISGEVFFSAKCPHRNMSRDHISYIQLNIYSTNDWNLINQHSVIFRPIPWI